MNIRQLLVVVACALIGAVIMLAPRIGKSEKTEQPIANRADESDFIEQLTSVKKTMDASALAGIEFFEERLNESTEMAKTIWLDSLANAWDSQMRPGIAAEYVFRKAEITNTDQDWLMAGKRYLSISRFFSGEDQLALNERATFCLEKASELNSNSNEIKTLLGAAYVEGGSNPMQGISLLKQVVESDPENIDALLNQGFFSMQSGQFDKAEERFNTVIGIKPEMVEVRLYLAESLSAQGKQDLAIKELQKIKEISEDSILVNEAERRITQIEMN